MSKRRISRRRATAERIKRNSRLAHLKEGWVESRSKMWQRIRFATPAPVSAEAVPRIFKPLPESERVKRAAYEIVTNRRKWRRNLRHPLNLT
jgi:hypothetical protein